MTIRVLQGDALTVLRTLPSESVHCVVTSPPYFGLRMYLPAGHPDKAHEIGLEDTPEAYLARLVEVFREVRRVLRRDGVCFVNLGDSYNAARNGGHPGGKAQWKDDRYQGRSGANVGGLKAKDLLMMPFRLALALQTDGWWLRSVMPWVKRSCLSGGTRVYAKTKKGEMPMTIKDMVRLDPSAVQLWNGERWTQVIDWWETERPDATYEIELRSGQRIGCTGDHLWPTQRGNVRADHLIPVGDLRGEPDVIQTCRLPESAMPIQPGALEDEMVGWFVGLYIAEGCRDEQAIHIASHTKEGERFARLRMLADAFHGSSWLVKKGENSCDFGLAGPMLRALVDTYVSGKCADGKHLNVRCWERSDRFLSAVLDGYLSGDGHWEENNQRWRLGFCNNDELAADLRTLGARLGVTVRLRRCVHQLDEREFPGYRGEIRFHRRTAVSGGFEAKPDGEVVAIRESRARKFWDIQVADEPHVYALASGVLTHNCMPESCTDRPTSAIEYVFMLVKSPKYFWDSEAVRQSASYGFTPKPGMYSRLGDAARQVTHTKVGSCPDGPGGQRNFRNSDLFFASLEAEPKPPAPYLGQSQKNHDAHGVQNASDVKRRTLAAMAARGVDGNKVADAPEPLGLMLDENGDPLALDVNPMPFKEAHFATFPPRLVEPLVKAGTSDRGCCPKCGAPWERAIMRHPVGDWRSSSRSRDLQDGAKGGPAGSMPGWETAQTVGWRQTCACPPADPVPCTVLDCFSGAGTTLLVADRLQRHAIGIDLHPGYNEMASERVATDAPLLAGRI